MAESLPSPDSHPLGADILRPEQMTVLSTQLRSALVADGMDAIGLRRQCLGPGLAPLTSGQVLVGTAFTVEIRTVDTVPEAPYQGLLAALDTIGPGEVYVAATGGADGVAIWGELITAACMARGARGSICDGYARDTALIRRTPFPVFCRGTVPYDSNGRSEVVGHGSAVQIDGVRIEPGDLIVADDDGVAVVPRQVGDEVVRRAIAKAQDESQFRIAVRNGMSAVEAFRTYGVL